MGAHRPRPGLPPTLDSRGRPAQILVAAVVPAVFGAICGLVLGWSAPAYLGLTVVSVLGGLGAGLEHRRPRAGLLRGLLGGTLFGTSLLLAHVASGARPTAQLPDPAVALVLITALAGGGLGALGAVLAARRARSG